MVLKQHSNIEAGHSLLNPLKSSEASSIMDKVRILTTIYIEGEKTTSTANKQQLFKVNFYSTKFQNKCSILF